MGALGFLILLAAGLAVFAVIAWAGDRLTQCEVPDCPNEATRTAGCLRLCDEHWQAIA